MKHGFGGWHDSIEVNTERFSRAGALCSILKGESSMNIKTTVGIVLLACSAGWTADSVSPLDVKLGQWETTVTSNIPMPAIPQEVLNKLPPEQRAKLQERMKANQGPRTSQSCLKKEDLDKAMKFGADDNSCTRTIVTSSRSKQEIHIECARGGSKQTGIIRIEATGPDSIKGSMEFGESGNRSANFSSTFTSKWLGPACKDK
jgi:hypothetical protein